MAPILIVEDSQTQAEMLRLTLEAAGFDSEVAVDGEAALARLAKSSVAMVISDIVMPGMSGYELCRTIKAEPAWKRIPVILLTSRKDAADIFRGLECGADNFYTKPYDPDRLLERIHRILEDKTQKSRSALNVGIEITRYGKTYTVSLDKEQILDLLISTFEDTVQSNLDLEKSRDELAAAKAKIENYSRRLEGRIRSSDEMYRTLFESIIEGIITIDAAGIILAVNPAIGSIFKYSADELIGQNVKMLMPQPTRDAHDGYLKKYEETGIRTIIGAMREMTGLRKDGTTLPMSLVVTEAKLNKKTIFVGVIRDLTEERTKEAELRQSQRLQSIGELTGGIAHDFNNILMVIMANVEELAEEDHADTETKARLERIMASTERATELTRRLLAFARKQPLQPRPSNLNDVVVDTSKMLGRTLGEHIEIGSILADDLWVTNIDRAQFESALVNLAINARDAMAEGGRLMIETRNEVLDEAYQIRNTGVVPGEYVMLAVSDTGHGIPPDLLERVFEPFFTTKGVGKGTGLGLSMVYGFIKQSGGHIKIYSEVGHGTTIRIYLPHSDLASVGAQTAITEIAPRGTERILVVEDDDLVRASVVSQLRSLGYVIEKAGNGVEGLARLKQGPAYDLLLTDVIMPGQMNGRALAEAALQHQPSLRVLYMSGYTENAIVHHGRLDAGVRLLSKPFRKIDLARAVRSILDSSANNDTA